MVLRFAHVFEILQAWMYIARRITIFYPVPDIGCRMSHRGLTVDRHGGACPISGGGVANMLGAVALQFLLWPAAFMHSALPPGVWAVCALGRTCWCRFGTACRLCPLVVCQLLPDIARVEVHCSCRRSLCDTRSWQNRHHQMLRLPRQAVF